MLVPHPHIGQVLEPVTGLQHPVEEVGILPCPDRRAGAERFREQAHGRVGEDAGPDGSVGGRAEFPALDGIWRGLEPVAVYGERLGSRAQAAARFAEPLGRRLELEGDNVSGDNGDRRVVEVGEQSFEPSGRRHDIVVAPHDDRSAAGEQAAVAGIGGASPRFGDEPYSGELSHDRRRQSGLGVVVHHDDLDAPFGLLGKNRPQALP